ncbi:hypothetical protein BJY16_007695 [Actinoplanes octamycinicus]|uniref:Cytosolic protein n=1 Tax=Actinoplanes octamycinicus TaxID=135948 RepID=A0A7W7H597_9ACTN|nr:DUF6282 family protein [Actinoplanes octamycinicus]MBB4744236.1 hypothetical protein [Actinoplanes octamycinicus]GIE56806.1 hypothetical protein Aoc01nite_22080 [Actinoplanes octamycinicus]
MHPIPTDRARELVAGGYDTHVHVAPDVMERRIDDVTLARRFAEVGLAGFVLKSHYVPTAERAQVVRGVVPGVEALGALTLNGSVGGLNPVAVEIAGRQGARIVWLPTVDSANERASRAATQPGATPPMWAALQDELAEQGIVAPPIEVLDEGGKIVPALHDVFAVLAKHDMVLATGHLSGPEIVVAVDAAAAAGVRRIIVTHPEFTSQQLDVDTQRQLAGRGALLERCFTTAYTKKVSWDLLFAHIREVGPEHSLLSSDLGQPFNPPVEDGLALLADRLLDAGFTEAEVRTMAVVNTRRVLGR